MNVVNSVLPLVSVLLGAAITYALNVRTQRRSKVEEVFHEAIAAVAVAVASHDFVAELAPWRGATPEEHTALNSQLKREGNENYAGERDGEGGDCSRVRVRPDTPRVLSGEH